MAARMNVGSLHLRGGMHVMRLLSRLAMSVGLIAAAAISAQAQSQEPQPQPVETRPATTTTIGDTGLWFTPTGEVLPKGRFSVSAYRVNFDRTEAFMDVSDFRGM